MKRTLSTILVLSLALLLGTRALAVNPTSGVTRITAEIGEAYTIKIPPTAAIAFNQTSSAIGSIGLETANLAPGHSVTFTTSSVSGAGEGNMALAGGSAELPFTFKIDGTATNTVSFSAAATKPVTIEIDTAAWNAAPAGSYSATITFAVSCG